MTSEQDEQFRIVADGLEALSPETPGHVAVVVAKTSAVMVRSMKIIIHRLEMQVAELVGKTNELEGQAYLEAKAKPLRKRKAKR